MSPELNQAITDLYRAFEHTPRPAKVEGCPCCADEGELRTMVEVPLRDLIPEQVRSYAFSALLTVGRVEDLRYFLPRLLELSVTEELEVDVEIILRKLPYGRWREWPPEERAGVEAFLEALTATFATQEWDRFMLDEWICGLGQMFEDTTPYLRPLLAPTPAAAGNLVRFYEYNRGDLKRGTLSSAFWQDTPTSRDRVVAWFRSAEVSNAVDMAYVRRDGFALEEG
jgi:hypothetical protein